MKKSIDDILKEINGKGYGYYYCETSADRLKKRLFGNHYTGINCSSDVVKYNDLSDEKKVALIYSCMSIVFEDKSNMLETIAMLNKIYDFDLVHEFNQLHGEWLDGEG